MAEEAIERKLERAERLRAECHDYDLDGNLLPIGTDQTCGRHRMARDMAGAAKFWVYHRGWVRLRLAPGATVHHYQGGPTDEGWSSHAERYTHAGDAIIAEYVDDGRDCDGRLTRNNIIRCALDRLTACADFDREVGGIPDWEPITSSQCDEYAEAAGY